MSTQVVEVKALTMQQLYSMLYRSSHNINYSDGCYPLFSDIARPSPFMFTYWKQAKTEGSKDLKTIKAT